MSPGGVGITLAGVAEQLIHRDDLTGRRQDFAPVLISVQARSPLALPLLEFAEAFRWQLIDVAATHGRLSLDFEARGALLQCPPDAPLVEKVLERGIPAVRIGHWPQPLDHLTPVVLPDRAACGRLAAEHFAERGFEHLAMFRKSDWPKVRFVYDALVRRAEELGCSCHLLELPMPGDQSPGPIEEQYLQEQIEASIELLRRAPKPLGLLALSDATAVRYCQWTVEAGLEMPGDLAILGMGDERFLCEAAQVPVSSVAFDHQGICAAAVEMLDQLMAGRTPDPSVALVPPKGIVTRRSTDMLATSDPQVAAALRYMWDNIDRDLAVTDIAAHVGVSRRTLERAFKADLGRGINQEFQRRRMERACQLLVLTDWQVGRIAAGLHFSSQRYFCQAFKTAFGLTPSQYRAQHDASPDDGPAR